MAAQKPKTKEQRRARRKVQEKKPKRNPLHSTTWDVADDEDDGFCAVGPRRSTRKEAEHDVERVKGFPISNEQVQEIESVANMLRGITMHLGIMKLANMGAPISSINACIGQLDNVTEAVMKAGEE